MGSDVRAIYHTTDLDGETELNPDVKTMRAVLASLRHSGDADFPDVSLVHGSGWAITVNNHWVAILERSPDDGTPPKVLRLNSLDEALALWNRLAQGDVETLLAEPWQGNE